MTGLVLCIAWVIVVFINAAAAGQRGRSALAWFFLSLLLSPILGLFLLLAFPSGRMMLVFQAGRWVTALSC